MVSPPPPQTPQDSPWAVEVWEDKFGHSPFWASYDKLDEYDQAVLDTVIEHLVSREGMNLISSEWGKALGQGLYEIRIRRDLTALINGLNPQGSAPPTSRDAKRKVLLRIFCTFHGNRVVLLFHVYNKRKDPSDRRQQKEIARARNYLKAFKAEKRDP